MVSIRKYLEMATAPRPNADRQAPPRVVTEKAGSHTVLVELCANILSDIADFAACDPTGPKDVSHSKDAAGAETRDELAEAKLTVSAGMSAEQARAAAQTVRATLAAYAIREKGTAQRIAMETQQVVGVLNDALVALAGGSQRSVSRLQRIQESLQRTSRIRDVDGLRASLGDAMNLVREESAREQEQAARDLAAFESQVVNVRQKLSSNPALQLQGRSEAVRIISDALRALKPDGHLFAVAINLENIHGVTQRYGPQSVDDLFLQVIRERIQPLAGNSTSWRWSPACVVAMFEAPADSKAAQKQLAELSRAQFVHRMTLGNRTAVLRVALSHLIVTLTPETLRGLISEIDRFSGLEIANAV